MSAPRKMPDLDIDWSPTLAPSKAPSATTTATPAVNQTTVEKPQPINTAALGALGLGPNVGQQAPQAKSNPTDPTSETGLYDNLKALITVVDDLRDVGLNQYIRLPRIAAIGGQSSGKSSVIEAIAGMDFLPRGEGLCTRCPLELRMNNLNKAEVPVGVGMEGSKEKEDYAYAVFERTNKKFTDFNQVRQEILNETDIEAGQNKAIVDRPIKLAVHATNAPDLTLIDLPGITLVPLKGSDQDVNIEYIQDDRTIILAVLPANQDMTTSDGLQMARSVDPQGLRTIGVITKLDIMDSGTDAVKMLKGEEVFLKLGYVGVKLRSQADIKANKRIKDALKSEKEWFENHRLYSHLPPGMTGMPELIKKLTKIMYRHIRHLLPDIRSEITERLRTVSSRLEELGEGVPLEVADQIQLVWSLINDYCECFKSTIRGRYDRKLQRYISTLSEINGGAQIRQIFNEFLIDYHLTKLTESLDDREIDRALRMHEGDSLPGFGNVESFEYLLRPQLMKVKLPAQECVTDVATALDSICQKIAKSVFRRFPKLADLVLSKTQDICYAKKAKALEVVEHTVNSGIKYRFTNDQDYLFAHSNMGNNPKAAYVAPQNLGGLPGGQNTGGNINPQQADALKQAETMNAMDPNSIAAMALARGVDPNSAVAKGAAAATWLSNTASSLGSQVKAGANDFFTDQNARPRDQAQQGLGGFVPGGFGGGGGGGGGNMSYSKYYVDELRQKLDAFFSISVRNWRDSIPKAIGYFLVRALEESLQFELFVGITQKTGTVSGTSMSEMLGEPPHISDERKSLTAQKKTLQTALDILTKDPQIASLALEGGGLGPETSALGRGSSGGGVANSMNKGSNTNMSNTMGQQNQNPQMGMSNQNPMGMGMQQQQNRPPPPTNMNQMNQNQMNQPPPPQTQNQNQMQNQPAANGPGGASNSLFGNTAGNPPRPGGGGGGGLFDSAGPGRPGGAGGGAGVGGPSRVTAPKSLFD